MAFDLFLVWYFTVGFLLANGAPHFAFGAAGKLSRSPFGQGSPPRTNVLWGVANFLAATIISVALAALGDYDSYSLAVLLLGFWLTVLMFGVRIKRFLND